MMDCYMMRRSGLPTIIHDKFNRANGYLGNADTGQAWLSGGSATTAWTVASNVAKRSSATSYVSSVAYIDALKSNVIVSASLHLGGYAAHSLVARMSGVTVENCVRFEFEPGGAIKIIKTISGSSTTLATASHSYTGGTTYECAISCIGNDFAVTIDGAQVLTATDDNALKTNTIVGMFLPFASGGYPTGLDYMDNFIARG